MRTKVFLLATAFMASVSALFAVDYPTRMFLVGEGAPQNNWDLSDPEWMVTTSPGVYTWTGKLNNGRMKFVPNQDWLPSYGPVDATAPAGTAELKQDIVAGNSYKMECRTSYEMPDKSCNMTEGRYKLTLNLTGEDPILTVEDGTNLPDCSIVKPGTLYLIGPAIGGENNWSFFDDQIFEETDNEGVYTWTGELKQGELKFCTNKDYGATTYGATVDRAEFKEGEQDVMVLVGVDYKFIVSAEQTGNYTLTLDLNNMKLNAVKNGDSGTATNISPEQEISWNITDDHIVCVDANQIEVLAISGTRIASCQGGQLDISNLHAGIYIAILHKDNQKSIHRFIVR